MIRKVTLRGKQHTVKASDVLGTGGEATVIKILNEAIKIYHKITPQREQKLTDFLNAHFNLPLQVCAPKELAYDARGNDIVGFAMPLMPTQSAVMQQLSSKSYRKAHPQFHSRFIADLFLSGYSTIEAFHSNQIIIGDNNDLNVMFHAPIQRNTLSAPTNMLFIDVDSVQFGRHPCMVGTENFLPPELYNIDLTTRSYFTEEHDWYAFLTMLIRSLILVHPFGGVHNEHRNIPQRALAKVLAFDKEVKYPKVASSPDLLNDDLHQLIERVFRKGERFKFPRDILQEFRDSLVECKSCHAWHPAERSSCPQCSTINQQQVTRHVKVVPKPGQRQVEYEDIFTTNGNFIWWQPVGKGICAISLHNGTYYLHKKPNLQSTAETMPLFGAKGDPVFGMFGKYLVVSQEFIDNRIVILDISGSKPAGYDRRVTDEFDGQRMFTTSRDHLFRIQHGYLYRGYNNEQFNQFTEHQVTSLCQNQTWIVGSPYATHLFGFERIWNHWQFFLYRFDRKPTGERYDIQMPAFEPNEALLDISIKFAPTSVLVLIKTEILGRTYTRVAVIHQDDGKILSTYRLESVSSDTHRRIGGKAFTKPADSHGMILHPTDDGVVQEMIGQNQIGKMTLFTETEAYVSESDYLMLFRQGILVRGDQNIGYLTII